MLSSTTSILTWDVDYIKGQDPRLLDILLYGTASTRPTVYTIWLAWLIVNKKAQYFHKGSRGKYDVWIDDNALGDRPLFPASFAALTW